MVSVDAIDRQGDRQSAMVNSHWESAASSHLERRIGVAKLANIRVSADAGRLAGAAQSGRSAH